MRGRIVAAGVGLFCWASAVYAASPTTDGSCTATDGTGTTATACSLTTSNTNDLIVAAGWFTNLSTTAPTISSVSGASLSWSLRGTQSYNFGATCSGSNQCAGVLAIYTAFSTGALSSQSITFNHSSTSGFGGIVIFGANGVFSSAAPFDAAGSLPSSNNNTSATANTPTVGLTTASADDLLLAFIGSYNIGGDACNGGTAPPTGYTLIAGAVLGNSCVDVSYKSVSASQSSTTVSWPLGSSQIRAWATFGDALTADSAVTRVSGAYGAPTLTGAGR